MLNAEGAPSRRVVMQMLEEAADAMAREQRSAEGNSLVKALAFATTIAVGLGALWLGARTGKTRDVVQMTRTRGIMR